MLIWKLRDGHVETWYKDVLDKSSGVIDQPFQITSSRISWSGHRQLENGYLASTKVRVHTALKLIFNPSCRSSFACSKPGVARFTVFEICRQVSPRTLPMSAQKFLTTGKKIVAIGRNFRWEIPDSTDDSTTYLQASEHAKELGNAVPKSPFFFLKPTSSYLPNGGTIEIPAGCEVHHEGAYLSRERVVCLKTLLTRTIVELAVVIGKEGRDCVESKAMELVAGTADTKYI